ncbi:signal recognition particle-docking protein FtsY [Halobacillus litoralis]|uniref:signal recognition particle-docking protein FtsY n=1 Tax=Halobacillus litoralis TaxID=45668 RepID=UPI001367F04E|nr:signal recognition particle-docking protein FtsY [Halobacillus litoralis]MYL37756.1 signal recognition particle-docking protein FtsY [Halobacillus litoralis]
MSFFKKLKDKFVKGQDVEEEGKGPAVDEQAEEDGSVPSDHSDEEVSPEVSTSLPENEEPPMTEEPAAEEAVDSDVSGTEEDDKEEEVESEAGIHGEDEADDSIPAAVEGEVQEEDEDEKETIASKFKKGLAKTRNSFSSKINDLVARYRTVDEDFFEELEEVLISADVGVTTVMEMIEELEMEVKRRNVQDPQKVKEIISEKLVDIYYGDEDAGEVEGLAENPDGLTVYLFVGVNGVGKTTTIGKLAHRLKSEGKNVTLAAGDTFRAGAIEQLEEWGNRVGVNVTKHSEGSDPAAVVYDGIKAAKSRGADVLICDTAGRLQNKVNLMNELSKVKRVIEREVPGAPHEVLLVLDATTGQNAMSQAKTFAEVTDVSGIVLSKLDGTAKGGIVLAIRNELEIPVKLVGLGEKVTDLETFDAHAFVYGLFAEMIEEYEEE